MFKNIKYIGALAIVGLPLYACSDGLSLENDSDEYTISETGEKTPLEMAVTLQDSYAGPLTRALNGTFEKNDELIAYVEQVVKGSSDGENDYTGALTDATKVSKLVTFTVGLAGSTVTADNLGIALYWDDFSNTSDDITKSDRWLRVGYGFCYNGGSPVESSISSSNDEVDWKVQDNQATENFANVRKSDLLWAGPQEAVQYDPKRVRPNVADKVKLPVTYTHAMSKVTIELVLDEGFEKNSDGSAKAFGTNNTTPVLYANKEAVDVNAKAQTLKAKVVSAEDTGIQMYLTDNEATTKGTRVYEAIIAPTVMKAGKKLASVEVDGNKYDLVLTDELLKTIEALSGKSQWSTQLHSYTSDAENNTVTETTGAYTAADGGITLSGINYRLKATLKKQKIEVVAKITDWTDVSASITGTIMFDADVKDSETSGVTAVTAGSFDLWRSLNNSNEASYGITKASTYTYDTPIAGKWNPSTTLYWVNGNTPYYFRALATTTNGGATLASVNGSTAAVQDVDLLWAQTSQHKAKASSVDGDYILENGEPKEYAAGAAIDPRTGNVPLTFEHAMSKISVILQNPVGAADDQKVSLADAKIEIVNLYNGGTISVKDGEIGDLTAPAAPESPITLSGTVTLSGEKYILANKIVIPQSLENDKNGNPRTTAPEFYSTNNLTAIYYSGTSIGTGTATYYLTSELTAVPVVLYTDEDADAIATHNEGLTGWWTTSKVKEEAVPAVPYSSLDDFNTDKHHQQFTADQFATLNTDAHRAAILKSAETSHEATQEDVDAGKAENVGDKVVDTPATYYDYDEYKALPSLTESQFSALPEELKIKTPAKPAVNYTQAEVDAHNQALDGYLKVGDVKIPAHYKLPDTTPTSHTPGELKSAGNKIMMYITLADGTRYSIELKNCLNDSTTDNTSDTVSEWKRGEHYTYTISLGKEEITFRALVKNWVEKSTSGNATLDWD